MAEEKTKEQLEDEKIEKTINDFRDRTLALRALAETQLKHARENQELATATLAKGINDAIALWTNKEAGDVPRARAINAYLDASTELESLVAFPHEEMLTQAIFVLIFSGLDEYLGRLLRAMFAIKPQLLNALDARDASESERLESPPAAARTVSLTDVLEKSKEEILKSVIDRVIESLIRKSYIESFDKLGSRFDTTLKDFANWPRFVECSQRRNVITHCGGIVTSQYMGICRAENVNLSGVEENQKLAVTEPYLYDAIEVVAETGLKVGQVLWRKLRESSLGAADTHLGNLIFELLKREQWNLALRLGEFGQECAKRKYKSPRSERSVKVILINHAQAAKWSGENEMALRIVNGADWSGSSLDFSLAVACLREDWAKAAVIMRELGKVSELINTRAYHNWPIFRGFRERPEFLAMFREVFDVEFADDVRDEGAGPVDPPPDNNTQDGNQ